MNTLLLVVCGLLLGACAGALHLGATWWRVRLGLRQRTALYLASYPLGLAAAGALIVLAATIAPLCAWVSVVGLFLVRTVVLSRMEVRP